MGCALLIPYLSQWRGVGAGGLGTGGDHGGDLGLQLGNLVLIQEERLSWSQADLQHGGRTVAEWLAWCLGKENILRSAEYHSLNQSTDQIPVLERRGVA